MGDEPDFKKWIQDSIAEHLIPIFKENGFKRGKTNEYVKSNNGIIQYITFSIRQHKVSVTWGHVPEYFPFEASYDDNTHIRNDERWISNAGVPGKLVFENGKGRWVAPEGTREKWYVAEKIVKESVLPLFDQIKSLDDLMSSVTFPVHTTATWNGVKWYIQGVYACLKNNFSDGIKLLKQSQACRKEYEKHLEKIGMVFGQKGDQLSVIFTYTDLFCKALQDSDEYKEGFQQVYEQICFDTKKWYKVK